MTDSDTVTIKLDDGSENTFDVLIFADGYRSMGRSLLFPEVPLNYRGYVLWRGVLEEKDLEDSEPLEVNIPRLSYKGATRSSCALFCAGT